MSAVVRYADSCPEECPSAPIRVPVVPCSMMRIRTGSEIVKFVEQCTRCGYLDPASLDRAAEDWYKRRQAGEGSAMRTSLAISGDPFTFVRSSKADITLDEALGQALGAAARSRRSTIASPRPWRGTGPKAIRAAPLASAFFI